MDKNIKEEVQTLEKQVDGTITKIIPEKRVSFDIEAEKQILEVATLNRDNTVSAIASTKQIYDSEMSNLEENLANYEKTILQATANIESYNKLQNKHEIYKNHSNSSTSISNSL